MNDGDEALNSWAPPPGSWRPPESGQLPVPPGRRPWRIVYWVTFGLLCATVAGLIVGFAMTAGDAIIPSSADAMAPAIQPGDVLMYHRGASGIVRGDVVLVRVPGTGLLARRVIGLPGDRVTCCDSAGRVTVNGNALSEDYLSPGGTPSQVNFAVTLGADQVWVMGDNRPVARDSRIFGPLTMSDIVGRVLFVSRGSSHTLLRTPATFTSDGLAPADDRTPLPLVLLVLALVAALAVVVQAAAGTITWVARRRRKRRQQPWQMAW